MSPGSRKRQLSLSVFVQLYGTHAHAWRRPGTVAGGGPSLEEWTKIVQQLERGKFDFAFFADFVGNAGDGVDLRGRQPRGGGFEPLTLVGALATLTKHIGLVATVNTNFNEPYNLARRLASLDHLTGGRSGWNIVSSLSEGAAKSFGVQSPLTPDGRYERASEFVDVSKQLWDSWDDDAFDQPNKDTGVFLDPQSAHPVHHHGKHFTVDTILDIARPLQGYPVFFQAGNSETGREFAAKYAEVIYAAAQTLDEAKTFYADVKGRMAKYGRERDHLKVTPGLFPFIGASRQEAQEKYRSFLEAVDMSGKRQFYGVDVSAYPIDGPLPENLPEPVNGRGRFKQLVALARRENLSIRELILRFSVVQGHRVIVGTANDVADELEAWFLGEGADGFNLKPPLHPDSLEDFIGQVVPQLQRRGIFRTDYEGTTLREHLGLPRPENPFTRAQASPMSEAKRFSKASDFPAEVLRLFDQYVHNGIDRAAFLEQAAPFAPAGTTAADLLQALRPRFGQAQKVAPTNPRIEANHLEFAAPEGYGRGRGYLVAPAGVRGTGRTLPVVLVVHENRGLNPHIEDVARRVALEGFLAFAPDALFPLGGYPGDEDAGRERFATLDREKTREDLVSAAHFAQSLSESNGQLGVVGFCYGGGIASFLATRLPDLGAAVSFYGGAPALNEVVRIRAPLQLHFAEVDERINAAWPAYADALTTARVRHEAFHYPQTQHGFHNDTTPRYEPAAATLAWQRTIDFFRRTLRVV